MCTWSISNKNWKLTLRWTSSVCNALGTLPHVSLGRWRCLRTTEASCLEHFQILSCSSLPVVYLCLFLFPVINCSHAYNGFEWVLYVLFVNYWTWAWFWKTSKSVLGARFKSSFSTVASNFAFWPVMCRPANNYLNLKSKKIEFSEER